MIEIDRTDEEREELVKQWIKDYWLVAVISVVLAIALVYGINYYRESHLKALSDAAEQTEQVLANIDSNQLTTAENTVTDLQRNEADTSFVTIATLSLAKKYFEDGNYEQAIAQYDWLIQHSQDIAVRDISRLRKARAEADAGSYAEAIATLGGVEDNTYITSANLLKGDIYSAQQQYDLAAEAYRTVENDARLDPQLIQQRLNWIAIKQQATVSP